MATLPEVFCWIKVIHGTTGKALPDGANIEIPPGKAVVRYVVANDSNAPAGPFWVVGVLRRNGVKVQPGGQPNVVPSQQITVQPNQIWKKEIAVSESSGYNHYLATIYGDVGAGVNEEDEANNQAKMSFTIYKSPP